MPGLTRVAGGGASCFLHSCSLSSKVSVHYKFASLYLFSDVQGRDNLSLPPIQSPTDFVWLEPRLLAISIKKTLVALVE